MQGGWQRQEALNAHAPNRGTEMKISKFSVVYSIALAVASIGVMPVATISAYAATKGVVVEHTAEVKVGRQTKVLGANKKVQKQLARSTRLMPTASSR